MNEVCALAVAVGTVALFALWAASRAALTVCLLEVTAGKARVKRGALSPRVLGDVADVVGSPPIARATLRIMREAGRARLLIRGRVPATQAQRLRNVVGSVPLAQLVNGRRRR